MSDERIKPCPFCGGEAAFIDNTRTIKCKCCGGAFVCTNPLITALEVAVAWNTRKPMERIISQAEAEIESSDKYIREYDDSEAQKAFNKGMRAVLEIMKGGGMDETD